ncbi:Catalase-like Protein [Tribolium castaneum]|uniref:Catalase-like Protein n=1 Tax=Tribolium castaneum TaxID=7070 RepID=D6X4D1_TRICA|nr:Catalase-like Protein [Tribolium castaneum]
MHFLNKQTVPTTSSDKPRIKTTQTTHNLTRRKCLTNQNATQRPTNSSLTPKKSRTVTTNPPPPTPATPSPTRTPPSPWAKRAPPCSRTGFCSTNSPTSAGNGSQNGWSMQKYTAAKVFAHVGKKTPIAVRFSQVAGEMGYPDTVRDVRGFAVKFYTEDGIWDLVGNNTPIFFIRDSILFPSFIHILKRNPVTHLRPDYDMFWDFISLRPETTHQTLVLFSDRGIPSSYRHMHGYGSNTFTLINSHGQPFYCKFHYLTNQGIRTLGSSKATEIAGQDPDFHTRDLYNAIATGNYPSWSFYIQIMTPEQAEKHPWDPFDVTKVWLHADFPLIPVGKLVLNRNPKNYFAEVEQMAFDPAHLIPGIEPSPDRMLQGRLFNYGDTARYRLGANNLQLPVNSPFKLHNFSRDGFATLDSQGGAPNYHPNSFGGPDNDKRAQALSPLWQVGGSAGRYDNGGEDWDNYGQARLLYHRVLKEEEKERLVDNIVSWLKNAAGFLQERAIKNFANVDEEFGRKIKAGIQAQTTKTHADL